MKKRKITEAYANAIYDILVKYAKAPEYYRPNFVAICDETTEYRFQGSLGFGGKFRNVSHRPWYVDCYPEDENPRRRGTMTRTNKKLAELFAKFNQSS